MGSADTAPLRDAASAPAARLRAAPFALPAAAFAATGALLFPASGRDDAYLTYWPAHTLARFGEIWNVNGEPIEQSSSLLEVLLLALLAKIFPLPIPTLGWCLSVAAGVSCVVFAARAAARMGEDARAAAWLVATAPYLLYWSFSGMEASLAALLGLAVVCAWSAHLEREALWPSLAAWLATAGFVLVRPEAILVLACVVGGLLALALLRGSRAGPALALGGVMCAAFAPLAWFRLAYFDSLFPQPAAAKSFTRLSDGAAGPLLAGLDYLVASAGAIFQAALWIGAAGAAAALLQRLRGGRVAAFELVAALFCAAYAGFVVTTGGDYMEGGRYLVPFVPVVLLLALVALRRAVPELRQRGAVALVALQLAGVLVFARGESTGVPLWDWAGRGAAPPPFTWSETANRVHLRDVQLSSHLAGLVGRLRALTGRPISAMTQQLGMVPYHVAAEHLGDVRFIDSYGLATRHVTDPAFAPLRPAWRRDRWSVLGEHGEELAALWGGAPDLHFGLGAPPEALARQGYTVVFRQSGDVRGKSLLFPGARVKASAWIAVRTELAAALRAAAAPPPDA